VYSIQKAGEIVVQNILAHVDDAPLVSYVPQRAKWLSDMGTTGATYLSEPQVPLRDINWMRQGRWVHQAKVDFEKYFVNRIRLQPASQAPSAASSIAGVMSRALAEKSGEQIPAPMARPSGGGKPLEIHLPQDHSVELRALAKSLGREPDTLAAELLAAAVSDAKSYLDEAGVEAMARSRRQLLVDDLPERQPGVQFHGGGT
jgi:sulfide:quinone oxidoreductase